MSNNVADVNTAAVHSAAPTQVTQPPKRSGKYKSRPDGVCQGPGCGKFIPGGKVNNGTKYYFCSEACKKKYTNTRKVIGTCERCGGHILDRVMSRAGTARFCSMKCDQDSYEEQHLSSTGPFREDIVEYVNSTDRYGDKALGQAKYALCRFFAHVVHTEKLGTYEAITPAVVARFAKAEEARGNHSTNWASQIRVFFDWLSEEERFDRRNPVLPGRYPVLSKTRDPYEETQVSFLWDLVERSDNTQLKLMFAIGLECGLRSCELINIRIQDVDLKKQTIFVRLPTKNMQTRIVNFHKKVKHYLEMWLRMRPPEITTDHLFYTSKTTPATHQLHSWIRDFFRSKPEPAASFEFHRLRHTWATRLVNAGMELPILQQLGGWKSLKSVQIYAKVRKSTVDHQYEAAYAAIEAEVQQPKEKSCSLFDFALMPLAATTTPADSAR